MKKIDTAYEIYSAHLKEYEEADPKTKTQKYLLQYNDISNRLYGQFEVVTSMLGLPFKETLDTYPSLDSIMRVVEQEDLRNKGESFFEELMGEIEIKNANAAKVYQNKSLEVTSSKEETIPKVFEPQGPVKILQRGKQPQSEMIKQTPIRIGANRDLWNSSYGGPNYRNAYQMGYPSENRNWEQRNGYGRRYGNGNRNQQRRAQGGTTTQTQAHHPIPKGRVPYKNTLSRRMGGGQVNGDGNGEDKDDKNKKRYRNTKYDFEEETEEEGDTEDSFEFEITPQQLSQVTPGWGGGFKINLDQKRAFEDNI